MSLLRWVEADIWWSYKVWPGFVLCDVWHPLHDSALLYLQTSTTVRSCYRRWRLMLTHCGVHRLSNTTRSQGNIWAISICQWLWAHLINQQMIQVTWEKSWRLLPLNSIMIGCSTVLKSRFYMSDLYPAALNSVCLLVKYLKISFCVNFFCCIMYKQNWCINVNTFYYIQYWI